MLIFVVQFWVAVKQYLKCLVHPRRLIIASEKKVTQLTIGVPIQLLAISLILGSILWSSYATGRFLASKDTLEAQSDTIRSVTDKRINNRFSTLLPTSTLLKNPIEKYINTNGQVSIGGDWARVNVLRKQVADLKNINEAIIDRVRKSTGVQIEKLELIVKQTGLNLSSVKKQAEKYQGLNKYNAEGGPYIPENMPKISKDFSSIFNYLDDLQTLRQITDRLPLYMPIKDGKRHSNFGYRVDPFKKKTAFHSGIDFAGPLNSPIYSPSDGVVIAAKRKGSYGKMIDINHGFGITTRYGHLRKIKVRKGDKVKKGDLIGIQGSTGRSTGSHLHYEVRFNGKAINPQKFLQTGKLLEVGNAISKNQR